MAKKHSFYLLAGMRLEAGGATLNSAIVLDRQGRVAAVYTGAVQQEDLRAVLDLLMAEED